MSCAASAKRTKPDSVLASSVGIPLTPTAADDALCVHMMGQLGRHTKSKIDGISVFVRVRPANFEGELGAENDDQVVDVDESGTSISVRNEEQPNKSIKCSFDRVFGPRSGQEDVFRALVPALDTVLQGFNACVLAYGQTGSGKTHTLIGPGGGTRLSDNLEEWGVIPRTVQLLFDRLASASEDDETFAYSVTCSFLQIYNENLVDLLQDGCRNGSKSSGNNACLQIREEAGKGRGDSRNRRRRKDEVDGELDDGSAYGSRHDHQVTAGDSRTSLQESRRVFVNGLSSFRVGGAHDVLRYINYGAANRRVRATQHNDASSRSHAVMQLMVEVESSDRAQNGSGGNTTYRQAKLSLVDLAGSEKMDSAGKISKGHFNELRNINQSLSALGNVVSALSEKGRTHVPYRDSKLTRLLQDSLGGNTRTTIIACVNPLADQFAETVNTLQFADRAKKVMVRLRANEVVDDRVLLARAQAEIVRLKRLLRDALEGALGSETCDIPEGGARSRTRPADNELPTLTSDYPEQGNTHIQASGEKIETEGYRKVTTQAVPTVSPELVGRPFVDTALETIRISPAAAAAAASAVSAASATAATRNRQESKLVAENEALRDDNNRLRAELLVFIRRKERLKRRRRTESFFSGDKGRNDSRRSRGAPPFSPVVDWSTRYARAAADARSRRPASAYSSRSQVARRAGGIVGPSSASLSATLSSSPLPIPSDGDVMTTPRVIAAVPDTSSMGMTKESLSVLSSSTPKSATVVSTPRAVFRRRVFDGDGGDSEPLNDLRSARAVGAVLRGAEAGDSESSSSCDQAKVEGAKAEMARLDFFRCKLEERVDGTEYKANRNHVTGKMGGMGSGSGERLIHLDRTVDVHSAELDAFLKESQQLEDAMFEAAGREKQRLQSGRKRFASIKAERMALEAQLAELCGIENSDRGDEANAIQTDATPNYPAVLSALEIPQVAAKRVKSDQHLSGRTLLEHEVITSHDTHQSTASIAAMIERNRHDGHSRSPPTVTATFPIHREAPPPQPRPNMNGITPAHINDRAKDANEDNVYNKHSTSCNHGNGDNIIHGGEASRDDPPKATSRVSNVEASSTSGAYSLSCSPRRRSPQTMSTGFVPLPSRRRGRSRQRPATSAVSGGRARPGMPRRSTRSGGSRSPAQHRTVPAAKAFEVVSPSVFCGDSEEPHGPAGRACHTQRPQRDEPWRQQEECGRGIGGRTSGDTHRRGVSGAKFDRFRARYPLPARSPEESRRRRGRKSSAGSLTRPDDCAREVERLSDDTKSNSLSYSVADLGLRLKVVGYDSRRRMHRCAYDATGEQQWHELGNKRFTIVGHNGVTVRSTESAPLPDTTGSDGRTNVNVDCSSDVCGTVKRSPSRTLLPASPANRIHTAVNFRDSDGSRVR